MGSVVVFLEVVWWVLLVCFLALVRGCLVGVVVGIPVVWWLLLVCLLELVRGFLVSVVVEVLWSGCEGGWVGEDMVWQVGVCHLGLTGLCLG